jgi:hypothetical protein
MSERATVSATHLRRCACVDVRQSTTEQVEHNRVDQTRCANESAKVSAVHLHRRACVDVCQSTTEQVEHNRVDRARRYAMSEHAKVSAAICIAARTFTSANSPAHRSSATACRAHEEVHDE